MFLFTFTVSYIHIVCILEVHTIDYSHFQKCAAFVIGNTAVVCRPNNWWKIMLWSVSNEIHISCSLSCYQILSESCSWHSEFSLFHLSVTVFQQQWQMKRLKVHKLVFPPATLFLSLFRASVWLWHFQCFLNKPQHLGHKTQSNKVIAFDALRWSPYTFCSFLAVVSAETEHHLLHPLEKDVTDLTARGQIYNLYIMCWFSPQSRSWSKGFSLFCLLLDNITQALKSRGSI